MLGGNLTVLAHLCGTIDPNFANGAVLFIEDVGEAPYRIDRCLVQLKRAGILSQVGGVITGQFTNCNPTSDGTTIERVLQDHLGFLNIPVAGGFPAAHDKRNAPFLHGQIVNLKVTQDAVMLSVDG